MISNQSQKGGDSSTNIQAQQMVVHVGIDEKRAREIYQEMTLQRRMDYSQEALNAANSRVADFENRLMPKMAQIEGALEAFADPSFQMLLVEAQKTAASTERPVDYDLLSELLIHRFQKGENRIARAGISLAVEIVDKISDEALLALTTCHAVSTYHPSARDIHEGLNSLNDLFGKIFCGHLPVGDEWLDHLDVLGAIRISRSENLKKIIEYYSIILFGYIDSGIRKDSSDHWKAIEIIRKHSLPNDILVVHELNSDFLRIPLPNMDQVGNLVIRRKVINCGEEAFTVESFSEEQMQAVISISELYSKDSDVKKNNLDLFMIEWDKRGNLKILREWWDSIPNAFAITSVGKVLAYSNAQRCDGTLPPLE